MTATNECLDQIWSLLLDVIIKVEGLNYGCTWAFRTYPMKRRSLQIVWKRGDSQMNIECTMVREPGYCLYGMLTMGAKGQFRLLQAHRTGMGTSLAFICLGQAWKFGQLLFLSFS